MVKFTQSKTFQILKDRWTNKDMEQYFIDKNRKFIKKIKKQIKK